MERSLHELFLHFKEESLVLAGCGWRSKQRH